MDVEQRIKEVIAKKLWSHFEYKFENEVEIIKPKSEVNGDYSSNMALKTSKPLGLQPMKLAEKLVTLIESDLEDVKIEVAAPGFINFFVTDLYIYKILDKIINDNQFIDQNHSRQVSKMLRDNLATNMNLSIDRIKSIQYVHSRASSVLKYFKKEGIYPSSVEGININSQENCIEKKLVKLISSYPTIIKDTAVNNNVEEFIQYLLEITDNFYNYHDGLLLRNLEKQRLLEVLKLLEGIKAVVNHSLNLMGYDAPVRM